MADEGEATEVIRAAGGLLWRQEGDRCKLAVVHRARHGGDRTLPKGKLQPDESWEQAAVREVQEETGCRVRLGQFAGSVSYLVEGVPKVVLFWNMTVSGKCTFTPSEEVQKLEWWPVEKATRRLDYEGERALVAESAMLCATGLSLRSRIQGWCSAIRRIWRRSACKRLASSHAAYSIELEHFVKQCQVAKIEDLLWADAALKLLDRVQQALDDADIALGWRCFNTARCMELYGLAQLESGQLQLESRAQAVLREADEKLGSWRRKAVKDILEDQQEGKGQLKSGLIADQVYQASQLVHGHHNNVYRRLGIIGRQLGILSIVALLAVVCWVLLAPALDGNGPPEVEQGNHSAEAQMDSQDSPGSLAQLNNRAILASVALFGIMGASMSGIVSLARNSAQDRIPQQLLSSWFTLTRPVVGALSASAIYVFLTSNLLAIGGMLSLGLILAVSFAAGFSERLVTRAVEQVATSSAS
jgi:8-oxo-dGTP diphosphatase